MQESLIYTSPGFPGIEALSCVNGFHFDRHLHDGHVIWLNSEGGEQYSLEGKTEILQPGSLSVIEPGIVHSNHPCSDSKRYLRSLYLDSTFLHHLEKMFTGNSTGKLHLPTAVYRDRISWMLLLELHEALVKRADRLIVDQLVLALFSRIWEGDTGSRERLKENRFDNRLRLITEYMQENSTEQIVLEDLARLSLCTSYHVIRIFKKQMGLSPHAYLIQLRLEKARQLLDCGSSIADAALRSGFSDQSHLTRKFKHRYGLTPGKYIRQISR